MDIDPTSAKRLNEVYPNLAVIWRRVAEDFWVAHKLQLKVLESLRTVEQQADLYAIGRTLPGKIVTYSKPGDSYHHYGLAIDSCFAGPDPFLESHPNGEAMWRDYGRIAVSHGFTWGGSWSRFVDRPHVQLTYGLRLQEVKDLYSYRGNDSVWAKCDQMRGVDVGTDWRAPVFSTQAAPFGETV